MIDLGFLTIEGEPRTNVFPARLITDAEMTQWQRSEVEAGYRRFCMKARLSLAWQQVEHLTLTDGSRIRYERRGANDRILVSPAQVADDSVIQAPIAWPAFVNLAYAPIFDRDVVSLGDPTNIQTYPDPPIEPTYPTLETVNPYYENKVTYWTEDCLWDSYIYQSWGEVQHESDVYPKLVSKSEWTIYADSSKKEVIFKGGNIPSDFLTPPATVATKSNPSNIRLPEANTTTVTGSPGVAWAFDALQSGVSADKVVYQDGTVLYYIGTSVSAWVYGGSKYDLRSYTQTGTAMHSTYATAADAPAQTSLTYTYDTTVTDWVKAKTAAVEASNAAALAAYDDAMTQYWTLYRAWVDACAAIDAANASGGYAALPSLDLLVPLRIAPRNKQISAVKTWLDLGISADTLHLNRRYLSFPFNIKCKHAYSMMQGGDATAGDLYDISPAGYGIDYTYSSATYSVALGTDFMRYDPQETNHRVGGNLDLTLPKNLYGWKVDGTYSREMLYAKYGYENDHVKNLANLSFSRTSDYDKQLASSISPDAATDLVIDSDAYVPAGTVVVLVQLEYEAWDKFTQQWLWTPCVSLFDYDAVWIESLGVYTDGYTIDKSNQGVSPRSVRVRRVLTQSRNSDLSWTAPDDFPSDSLNPAGFATHEFTDTWSEYPTSIVLVRKLAKEAAPLPVGSTTFSHNETAVFTTMGTESFKTLLSEAWASNQTLTKLTADCLKYVYKVS